MFQGYCVGGDSSDLKQLSFVTGEGMLLVHDGVN